MKRFFDIALSILLIILFSPIMMFISVLVFMNLGNNVLFIQKRPGLNATIFGLIKFRTMLDAYDENGVLLSDVERLTKFGKFLRSTSLDEIPSLFNVLKGDMSLVGPRPLLVKYLSLYSAEQARRHNVRPGITGWAQVNGRNAISWEDKFKLDVWYVDNNSFFLDLKILFLTIKKVFLRDGISADGEATMSAFKGKND